jgi:hypothetical protein
MRRITFETAKLARTIGFKESCFSYYSKDGVLHHPYLENGSSTDTDFRVDLEDLLDNHNEDYSNDYSAPYQAELQEWLRNIHNIQVYASSGTIDGNGKYIDYIYTINMNSSDHRDGYESYEDALDVGLLETLKLLKNAKSIH